MIKVHSVLKLLEELNKEISKEDLKQEIINKFTSAEEFQTCQPNKTYNFDEIIKFMEEMKKIEVKDNKINFLGFGSC